MVATAPVAPAPTGTQPGSSGLIINSNDQATNDSDQAAAPAVATAAPATKAPVIVTSGQSRTQYANNVSGLNTALGNLSSSSSNNPSIVDYLNSSGLPSDYASRSALAASKGIPAYTGSASQNMQLLQILQQNLNGSGTGSPAATGTAAPVQTQPAATATDGSTTNADGSTTNPDGTTTNADGSTTDPNDPTSGLPPAIASAYKDTLTQQDQNITDAQTSLDQARATMANDPAAQQAVTAIQTQYGVLIDAMKRKNDVVLGGARENAARDGSLQFANEMETNFMSDEMDQASQRLSTLVGQEQAAILKSNTAYQNADVKAFNAAQSALDKATTDKSTTLGKLLTATNNQVKAVQAQQKIDAATKKASLASDVTTSAKIAAAMAQSLSAAGITDPDQVKAYVQAMATKNGISNTDILQSALVTTQAANSKADLAASNTKSEIQKRGSTASGTKAKGGGTDGGYTYTGDDISSYTDLLNTGTVGGQLLNGVKYGARGSDGYVDPGTYTAVYTDWMKNNGTVTGFLKKFPVKGNVNPSSYSSLPAALQPASSSSKTGYNA